MKNNARDLEKNIKLLKSSLNPVHDFIKIHTYWLLLEELMNNNLQNVDYVRDRWNLFNNERVKMIDKNSEKSERHVAKKETIIAGRS
jgi:hypothetical protein